MGGSFLSLFLSAYILLAADISIKGKTKEQFSIGLLYIMVDYEKWGISSYLVDALSLAFICGGQKVIL